MAPPLGRACAALSFRALRARSVGGLLLLASGCLEAHTGSAPADAGGDPASSSGQDDGQGIDTAPAQTPAAAPAPAQDAAPAQPVDFPRDAAVGQAARPPREGGPAAPGPLDCEAQRALAAQGVSTAADGSDKSCRVDTDCTLVVASASCSDYCTVTSLANATGTRMASDALAALEHDLCVPYAHASCPQLAGRCALLNELPRCRAGRCEFTSPSCPAGCASEGDGPCRAYPDYACDGCPSVPSEADGLPCANPGQDCFYPPSCGGAEAQCVKDESGAARWFVTYRLC